MGEREQKERKQYNVNEKENTVYYLCFSKKILSVLTPSSILSLLLLETDITYFIYSSLS